MKHTPGPWTLEEPEHGGRVMAGAFIVHEPPGSPHHHELRADARLFAAAPDLLEALSRIEELDRRAYHLDDVNADDWDLAIFSARDAILKATEGES